MTFYVANAFSIQMMEESGRVVFQRLSDAGARAMMEDATDYVSCVGHEDTAAVFSHELGKEIKMNRTSVTLTTDDQMLVGQLTGGRLPEGAKELPEDFRLQWWLVFRQA